MSRIFTVICLAVALLVLPTCVTAQQQQTPPKFQIYIDTTLAEDSGLATQTVDAIKAELNATGIYDIQDEAKGAQLELHVTGIAVPDGPYTSVSCTLTFPFVNGSEQYAFQSTYLVKDDDTVHDAALVTTKDITEALLTMLQQLPAPPKKPKRVYGKSA